MLIKNVSTIYSKQRVIQEAVLLENVLEKQTERIIIITIDQIRNKKSNQNQK